MNYKFEIIKESKAPTSSSVQGSVYRRLDALGRSCLESCYFFNVRVLRKPALSAASHEQEGFKDKLSKNDVISCILLKT